MGLGLDHVLLARNALESLAQIGVRAVLIGDVEEADSLVDRMADDLGESLDAQAGLVAGLSRTHAAGSHPDEGDLDCRICPGRPFRSGSWEESFLERTRARQAR